jgi:hypothetical protein
MGGVGRDGAWAYGGRVCELTNACTSHECMQERSALQCRVPSGVSHSFLRACVLTRKNVPKIQDAAFISDLSLERLPPRVHSKPLTPNPARSIAQALPACIPTLLHATPRDGDAS